jgi:hypothetical protein
MNAFIRKALPALFIVATSWSLQANAAQGGIIHFRGAIVEDPCNISPSTDNISFRCLRDGGMKTSVYSLHQAEQGVRNNANLSAVKMDYINPKKTMAVLTVTYN